MQPPWFVRGDIDGFFGLFLDNLLQLMVIAVLGGAICGFPPGFIAGTILPGAALSILAGNLFYAWQARRLALQTGRSDITALPYGINTPSVMAFIFLVMGPVYQETKDTRIAWQAGLMACFLSGLMEVAGAFCGDWLRKHTPRAALLSALAGIALTFISMGFVFQLYANPALGVLPMLIILTSYASRRKLPFGFPAGLLAVLVGTAAAWILHAAGFPDFRPAHTASQFGFHPVQPSIAALWDGMVSPIGWRYLAVILPMGLFTVIGSLQNLESAEAAGDRFETRPSLLANGVGTLLAACFGSPFPTTIYIGHPGWKAMGARAGYSILNGILISLLCVLGGVTLVLRWIPMEAMLGILLWIGIIITGQAFQETPKRHALAVAAGFIPALAAWAQLLVETSLRVAGSSLETVAPKFGADLHVHGMIALGQGFILTSMILASIVAFASDGRFLKAAAWSAAGALLSAIGIIHAYTLTPRGVQNKFDWIAAPAFAGAYALGALYLVFLHLQTPTPPPPSDPEPSDDAWAGAI